MATGPYLTDPLVCLCKLAILSFMPPGTKLSFGDHLVKIQSAGSYQWLERSLSGDRRTDVSRLWTPLGQVIRYYLRDPDPGTRILVEYAIQGLEILRDQTYADSDAVRIILQYYIGHLSAALQGQAVSDGLLDAVPAPPQIETPSDEETVRSISQLLQDAARSGRVPDDARALVTCTHSLLRSRERAYLETISPRVDWIE